MPVSLSTVNAISKEIYEGKINDQLQSETVGLKRIERTSEGVTSNTGGRFVYFPVRIGRNHGIGSRSENDDLPLSGNQGYARGEVKLKYAYGRVNLTGQVMELVNENYQAFASALDQEMNGLKDDLAKDQNRQFYGDSTGTLATCGATAAVNTFTVDTTGVAFGNNHGTKYLEIGMIIDVGTAAQHAAGTQPVKNRTITNIVGTVVTFSGAAATLSAASVVTRTGSFGKEINGLGNILGTNAILHRLDNALADGSEYAGAGQWSANRDANAGTNRALSEGLMINLTDTVRTRGGRTSLILTTLGVRRAYFNLLSQQRRYPSTTTFEGGFTGLAFNNGREIPVVEDVDATPNNMFFLDEDKLKVYRTHDWKWLDRDGSIWKWVQNKDAYEAVISTYWELATKQRNAHGVLADITEG